MEAEEHLGAHDLLNQKVSCKQNGRTGIVRALNNLLKSHNTLHIQSISRSECAGSCPDLMMSRSEHAEGRPVAVALTPQLAPRAHRPLCMSVSSDSSGRFKALETQEWKNNLRAQMEQAHSAGAASSTGSLERSSLFCASEAAAAASSSGSALSSPCDVLAKGKSSSRFSLFSPPWNSSSESDSNPPSRSGSAKLRNYRRRAATGPAGARGPDPPAPAPTPPPLPPPATPTPQHFQHAEPLISRVTDYIYVGNLNAAYSGRTLCRNNIDSVIDMSGVPGEPPPAISLVPCTCSRGARHCWSRLKVDISSLEQRCFHDINECIEASAGKRRRVLVHCRDGFSLAPTCVIQYLMVRRNMRLLAAYELLRARHPVNIGERHQDLLVGLEGALRPGGGVHPDCFKQALSRRLAWT
ncbi:uncharacterized protein LOC142890041 [Nelusetta ayraudi]|uniref:uncharacterized protein LOC142890041 n=1 Tax=Nelusetta ayraudi TaxID=303726 RepID=UPI003F712CF6